MVNKTPDRVYWLCTLALMPVAGVAAVIGLTLTHRTTFPVGIYVLIVAGLLGATAAIVARLPRVRALAPRQRLARVALSAAIQLAVGFVLFWTLVLAAIAVVCGGGACS